MGDEEFYPAFEDDDITVEQLLAEPQIKEDLDECLQHMNYGGSRNFVALCDFSCAREYPERQTDWCVSNPCASSSRMMELKHEFADDSSQAFDGGDISSIPWDTLSIYPADLSDPKSSSLPLIDYTPDDMSGMITEQSRQVLESDKWNNGMSPMSDTPNLNKGTFEQESKIHEKMSIGEELHQAFKATFGRDTGVKDEQSLRCHLLLCLESITETNTDSGAQFSASDTSAKISMLDHPREITTKGMMCASDSLIRKNNPVRGPRGHRKRRTFPRPSKNSFNKWQMPLSLMYDGKLTKGKKGRKRRNKGHWTLQEVKDLVEGVSQYGVGRWTEVKRSYFSLSVRTSVNLKDKWRNLLKASQDISQRSFLLHIPEPVMQRIRELSAVHPYPKEMRYA